jgi:hypothetical protein
VSTYCFQNGDAKQASPSALKRDGVLAEDAVTSFAERERLVGKPAFDALEARYATPAAPK